MGQHQTEATLSSIRDAKSPEASAYIVASNFSSLGLEFLFLLSDHFLNKQNLFTSIALTALLSI